MKSNVFKIFLLTLALFLVGGIVMTNAQEKPPLLNNPQENSRQKPPLFSTPQNVVYGQTVLPPPPGQVLPPPPPGQPAPPPPPPEQDTFQPQVNRPFNGVQLKNASLAVATAKKAKPYLTAGRIWTMIGPRGDVEIKAAILYDRIAATVLHFNPVDGSILPLGVLPIVSRTTIQLIKIKDKLPAIIRAIEVLDGAEYREPENAWVVPLAYKDMIVGYLKIYVDGIHVVPDYPANQEMQVYGK